MFITSTTGTNNFENDKFGKSNKTKNEKLYFVGSFVRAVVDASFTLKGEILNWKIVSYLATEKWIKLFNKRDQKQNKKNNKCLDCGRVVRAVPSNTRVPGLKSSIRQFFNIIIFWKIGHSRPLFFFILNDKFNLPMTGFELYICRVRSDCSTYWDTTTAIRAHFIEFTVCSRQNILKERPRMSSESKNKCESMWHCSLTAQWSLKVGFDGRDRRFEAHPYTYASQNRFDYFSSAGARRRSAGGLIIKGSDDHKPSNIFLPNPLLPKIVKIKRVQKCLYFVAFPRPLNDRLLIYFTCTRMTYLSTRINVSLHFLF